MLDDKKMNELSDDQLKKAAGGMVSANPKRKIFKATSENPYGRRPSGGYYQESKGFATLEEAQAYAKNKGWDTTIQWNYN